MLTRVMDAAIVNDAALRSGVGFYDLTGFEFVELRFNPQR